MVARFCSRAMALVLTLCFAVWLLVGGKALASNTTFSAGTGITITVTSGATSRVIANSGVTSLTGTANQVNVSVATGAVTLSLIGPYTPATYTAHGALIGEGTSSITALAVGTNGQVLVGSTGADPIFATIGCSGCSWTTGAGTLSLTVGGTLAVTNNPSCTAGAYTVLTSDVYIRASASGAANCVLNLPAALAGNIGRVIYVKREDSNAFNVNVTPNGTDTIDGVNAADSIKIQYDEFGFVVGAAGAWDVL